MAPQPQQSRASLFEELEDTALSTQKGYKVGEQMFNIYAAHQNVSVLGAITEEECSAHDGDYIKT
jgi:hypothetical protein